MRYLLIAAFVSCTSYAAAFDGAVVSQKYNEARPACRQGELHGQPISTAESAKQCEILAQLGKELTSNGYCWNATEQEWIACK